MGKHDNLLREREETPREDLKPLKERIYDKIPISVKALDVIIALLFAAIVAFIIIGALKGKGMI